MTSTSRIARCGPACRVVWQGRSCKLPPMPIFISFIGAVTNQTNKTNLTTGTEALPTLHYSA